MKKFLLSLLIIPLLIAPAYAQVNYYGGNGSYQGRMDNNGNIYGGNGSYQGRIDNNNNMYGGNGSYQGRMDTMEIFTAATAAIKVA